VADGFSNREGRSLDAAHEGNRALRHTAPGGLLDGTRRFGWGRAAGGPIDIDADSEAVAEGLTGAGVEAGAVGLADRLEVGAMALMVRSAPRPDRAPLPREGCRDVQMKVLLERDHLLVAMLRLGPGGTIDGDVIRLEGRGMTSVGGERASIQAGERVPWPRARVASPLDRGQRDGHADARSPTDRRRLHARGPHRGWRGRPTQTPVRQGARAWPRPSTPTSAPTSAPIRGCCRRVGPR
jgi:hypothetical protein